MADSKTLNLEVGETIGVSPWLRVTQADIDVFGAATRDLEPLHNDPAWCAENSPFGAPIAYGFQTIGLLTHMLHEATDAALSGGHHTTNFPINYGFNRLRLITPVTVGSEIRAHFKLVSKEERRPGELMFNIETTVEIRDNDSPALVGEWLYLWVTGEGRQAVSRSVSPAAR